jgi:hypothetical protein
MFPVFWNLHLYQDSLLFNIKLSTMIKSDLTIRNFCRTCCSYNKIIVNSLFINPIKWLEIKFQFLFLMPLILLTFWALTFFTEKNEIFAYKINYSWKWLNINSMDISTLRWPSKFYIGLSKYRFPIGRGLGISSFRPAVSDHSNDCFRGDRTWIKIKKIFCL